jgi:hypothetical protein
MRGGHVPYGASPGVSGSDGGGGRLISVGALVVMADVLMAAVDSVCQMERRRILFGCSWTGRVRASGAGLRDVRYDVDVQGSKNARAVTVTRTGEVDALSTGSPRLLNPQRLALGSCCT